MLLLMECKLFKIIKKKKNIIFLLKFNYYLNCIIFFFNRILMLVLIKKNFGYVMRVHSIVHASVAVKNIKSLIHSIQTQIQ